MLFSEWKFTNKQIHINISQRMADWTFNAAFLFLWCFIVPTIYHKRVKVRKMLFFVLVSTAKFVALNVLCLNMFLPKFGNLRTAMSGGRNKQVNLNLKRDIVDSSQGKKMQLLEREKKYCIRSSNCSQILDMYYYKGASAFWRSYCLQSKKER